MEKGAFSLSMARWLDDDVELWDRFQNLVLSGGGDGCAAVSVTRSVRMAARITLTGR